MEPVASCGGTSRKSGLPDPVEWFAGMIDHCSDHAEAARARGHPIVGILCEFTPRELILAAGAVPVCLCGGAHATISAAEHLLPTNLCPLIKSTFGYHVTGKNPFLEAASLVVAETTCDGKKKMFELMSATKDLYVLELPQKAADPDAFERWLQEIVKFKAFLEKKFQVKITPKKLRQAIGLMNRERGLRRELAALMAQDPPPLTGRQLLDFKSIISGIEDDLRQYQNALRIFSHRRRRPAKPEIRVLLTGVPVVHGAERVVDLIEQAGGVVVAMENCTGLKPILEDVPAKSPPLRAIARKYYHLPCSVMTPNDARLKNLRALAARFKPHCLIELIWHACLTYDVESYRVRRLAIEELKLPYLKIATDYSPWDSARISARVEALFETIRGNPPHEIRTTNTPA